MNNANFFIGAPVSFHNKCFIYPPTVRDVLTNPLFGKFEAMLTSSQEDLNDELLPKIDKNQRVPTPFEFLFINSFHNKEFEVLARQALEFFLHIPVSFLYEQKWIVLGNLEEVVANLKSLEDLVYIEESEYFELQNLIREACGHKVVAPYVEDPDEDPRVRRIKAKARARDRIKAKKGSKNGITFITSLKAICCMGLGITPLNIGEMSYASIGSIVSMYQDKEKYDLDIRSLLAGASSKKIHPQYWIKND